MFDAFPENFPRIVESSRRQMKDVEFTVQLILLAERDPAKRRPFEYDDRFRRGVIRYFDVRNNPPHRGRPRVDHTLTLEDVVDRIATARAGPTPAALEWSDPE
jgi:hypothetical protein